MKVPSRYLHKFTRDEINSLPLYRYDGPVHLISKKRLSWAVDVLSREYVLGFDTETKPSFRKGVNNLPALLQLATDREVFLFPLNKLSFPGPLRELLSEPSIIKTGVAVRDDIKGLGRIEPFKAGGFVDLAEVAQALGLQTFGLRTLLANFLGKRISKRAQCSNWARKELTPQQIRYAATDAWVSREIHMIMVRLGFIEPPDGQPFVMPVAEEAENAAGNSG